MIWGVEICSLCYLWKEVYKMLSLRAMWYSFLHYVVHKNNPSYIYTAVLPWIYEVMSFPKAFEQIKCQKWELNVLDIDTSSF